MVWSMRSVVVTRHRVGKGRLGGKGRVGGLMSLTPSTMRGKCWGKLPCHCQPHSSATAADWFESPLTLLSAAHLFNTTPTPTHSGYLLLVILSAPFNRPAMASRNPLLPPLPSTSSSRPFFLPAPLEHAHTFHAHSALNAASKVTLQSAGVGLLVSAVQNALEK